MHQPAVQGGGVGLHALELRGHGDKMLLKCAVLLRERVPAQLRRRVRLGSLAISCNANFSDERVYAQLQLLVARVRPLQLQL